MRAAVFERFRGDEVVDVLSVRMRLGQDAVEIRVAGDLDIWNCPQLASYLQRLLSEGRTRVVLDLGGLRSIDSNGLSLIVGAHRQFEAAGGELLLTNPLRGVRRVMDITGVSALVSGV